MEPFLLSLSEKPSFIVSCSYSKIAVVRLLLEMKHWSNLNICKFHNLHQDSGRTLNSFQERFKYLDVLNDQLKMAILLLVVNEAHKKNDFLKA